MGGVGGYFYESDKLCSSERGTSVIETLSDDFSSVSKGKQKEILLQVGSIIELGMTEFQNNRG